MIKDPIRAMVLAAGVGSRLQPLTDHLPKPLVKIGGRAIMEHILLLLKSHGVTDIISNTHHLADKIHDYFQDIKAKEGINIEFVYEEKLSGVAGGIRRCKDFLSQSTACIVMGDALTDVNLTDLYNKHKEAVDKFGCLATIAQMQVEDTSQFGVIVTESLMPDGKPGLEGSRIVKFQEKPKADEALSNWANTGIYFFEPKIYDFIPDENEAAVYDVAKDLFPKLLEAGEWIQAISVDAYWADLGTPDQYIESSKDISSGKVNLDIPQDADDSAELQAFNEFFQNK